VQHHTIPSLCKGELHHISRWWRCERWEESETEPNKDNRAKLGDTDTQKNTDGTNKMLSESIMDSEDTGQQLKPVRLKVRSSSILTESREQGSKWLSQGAAPS